MTLLVLQSKLAGMARHQRWRSPRKRERNGRGVISMKGKFPVVPTKQWTLMLKALLSFKICLQVVCIRWRPWQLPGPPVTLLLSERTCTGRGPFTWALNNSRMAASASRLFSKSKLASRFRQFCLPVKFLVLRHIYRQQLYDTEGIWRW